MVTMYTDFLSVEEAKHRHATNYSKHLLLRQIDNYTNTLITQLNNNPLIKLLTRMYLKWGTQGLDSE